MEVTFEYLKEDYPLLYDEAKLYVNSLYTMEGDKTNIAQGMRGWGGLPQGKRFWHYIYEGRFDEAIFDYPEYKHLFKSTPLPYTVKTNGLWQA